MSVPPIVMAAGEPAVKRQKPNDDGAETKPPPAKLPPAKPPAPAPKAPAPKAPAPAPDPASSRDAQTGLVPTTKPVQSQTIVSPKEDAAAVLVPSLPSTEEEILRCDVRMLMRSVMSWCRVVLVQRLSTDEKFKTQFVETEFWRERPLQIAVADNDASLVGFKPPWQKAQCLTAIDQRQMYEAAINIDWLKTISADADDRVIAGDEVTYADVERIRCALMIICEDVLHTVQKSEDLPVEQRKHFSFVFACHTPAASYLDKDAFQHELVLLDGHAFVWGMVAPSLPPAFCSSTVAEQHYRPAPSS